MDVQTGRPVGAHVAPNTACYVRVKNNTSEPLYVNVLNIDTQGNKYMVLPMDEGFLFLMIDFRYSFIPLIQVRTWQPYKDMAGNIVTQRKDVFHLGSFRIVR